jgi:hypothetical protein
LRAHADAAATEGTLRDLVGRIKFGGMIRLWVLAEGCPGLNRFYQVKSFLQQGTSERPYYACTLYRECAYHACNLYTRACPL